MTKITPIPIALFAILVSSTLLAHEPVPQPPHTPRATVTRLTGGAQIRRAGADTWQDLTVGMKIAGQDTFATGFRSEIELVLTDDAGVSAVRTVPSLTQSTLEDYVRGSKHPKALSSQGFLLQMGDSGVIEISRSLPSVPNAARSGAFASFPHAAIAVRSFPATHSPTGINRSPAAYRPPGAHLAKDVATSSHSPPRQASPSSSTSAAPQRR